MATRTLVQLRTEARQRADMENDDSFVSDAELTRMVNQSIKELYDLLIQYQDHAYYATSTTATMTPGTASYALPSTFYRLLGVDVVVSGVTYTLKPFHFQERNKYSDDTWSFVGRIRGCSAKYRINGSNIVFSPVPDSAYSYTLWYAPQFVDLAHDTNDSFEGINGWEEYVVVDAAMKMLEKEESDVSHLQLRKAQLTERIVGLAADRDAGMPSVILDVDTINGGWFE